MQKIDTNQVNKLDLKHQCYYQNYAPFISCMSKINNTLIDNAEDLDIVMSLYNLI